MMKRVYDFSPCKSRGKHDNFEKYLASKIGPLSPEISVTLNGLHLDRLHWSWWPAAADAAAMAVAKGGAKGLAARFSGVCRNLDEFDAVGLHTGASAAQVVRAHIEHEPFNLNQQEFARYLAQLIEAMGQDLLIHRLPGNEKVTKLGRKMMEVRHQFLASNLKNSQPWLSDKSAEDTLHQRDAAACADLQHRVRETALFALEDLGYVGRRIYITAPTHFSPGPHRGDLDPRWVAAGKPGPYAAWGWLNGVVRKAYKAAAQRGIVPIGARDVEAFVSGVPHLNLPLFFVDDAEADQFIQILRDAYHTRLSADMQRLGIRHARAFSIDVQAIVTAPITDAASALQAAGYAAKHVKPYVAAAEDEQEPEGLDRLFCELHGITQHQEWGTGRKLGAWKTLKRLSGVLVKGHEQAGTVPDSLVAAWQAANGEVERSYRTWLRLTHPLTPARLRRPVWTDKVVQGGRLFVLSEPHGCHTITFEAHPCIARISPSSKGLVSSGQLDIVNPTKTETTTFAPSNPPPRASNRRRFDFTRRRCTQTPLLKPLNIPSGFTCMSLL